MIHLHNVSKQFGKRWAVRNLTLHIPQGEIYGLLGHNGAGKSTAIGMILGQVWPTKGDIRVCGHDVTAHRQDALRQVGAIFETPAFYEELSGWRNLEILCGYTAAPSPDRLKEVIDWVGLSGREHGRVRTYSHGMRARLALAQALLPKPSLLILDEPGDGLDPEGIHELRLTIARLHRDMGLTILLSSHLLNEVQQLCTRIAVLRQGTLVFEGPLSDTHSEARQVRLRTSDFDRAVQSLTAAGLITGTTTQATLALAPGIETDVLTQFLVEHQFRVFEIAPSVPTLEDFYLELMHQPDNRPSEAAPGHPPR